MAAMAFASPEIAGPIFELLRTVEFDVAIGEAATAIRVELFQAMDDATRFRARVWQREELPLAAEADEGEARDLPEVLAERAVDLGEEYLDFEAEDSDAALQVVLEDLTERIAPWSPGKGA